MCTLPKRNKGLLRRCAAKGLCPVKVKAGRTRISRISAGLILLVQLVMMHPYVVYGEPPRPAPPEILSPGENCFETVPLFPLADAPGISWPLSGETAQAAGTEPDTAPPVSETAEASGAVRQAESRGIRRFISAETGGLLVLGDAEIEIPPEALAADTEIRISRLSQPADTGGGLTNVTAGGGGYRFEPAGLIFNRAVTIRMGYDPRLRENEPALEHIYTYFYDTKERCWEKLERLSLDRDRRWIISLTTHFTDMINGTLTLPESPKPPQFNINSIKGLEAADPDTGVPGLEGLEANNAGIVSFQFELDLPPGRNGMTPRVAAAYSSDNGNSIMGRGFDLQYGSRITIDTRYYGARYFDPKTSRWISADPAMGEYIPVAPINDEARRRNENLPGMGGVFNYVNLHVYHYAGNNPVKYADPDGKEILPVSAKIRQQDSKKQLGTGATTIAQEGCVLTTIVRIANAIIGDGKIVTLEEANELASRRGLYTNKSELSLPASAKLLSALTGKDIAFGFFEGSESKLISDIENLDKSSYEFYITGRIKTLDRNGNIIGHQVSINEKAIDISLSTAPTKIQPLVDTSTKDRKTPMGDSRVRETLFKIYWFSAREE